MRNPKKKKLSAQTRKANALKFKKKKKFIGTVVDSGASQSCIGIFGTSRAKLKVGTLPPLFAS